MRIGVTGHRQLPDEESLSEKIRQVLKKDIFDLFDKDSKKIIDSSPHTPIAFSILTPLAEGSDRLAAKEVLKLPDSRIEVVLPLTKEDYLQDFNTQESRQEFEGLLILARRPITLKRQNLSEEFPQGDLAEARRRAYEDVGRYVVDHCDILIALWDGEPSRGKGGTAEIIDYAEKRNRPVIIISTIPPYEISIKKGYGLGAETFEHIKMFNSHRISERSQKAYINKMYNSLFDNPEGHQLPEKTKELVRDKLLPSYVRASNIAKYNQKIYLYVGSLAYILSTIAIASVVLGILVHRLSRPAFILESILLAIIFFSVFFANKRRTHKNWIENRFLAERIRSAIFLVCCDVEVSPIEVPPYMRPAHQAAEWMVKVFSEIWDNLPPMRGCQGEYCRQCNEFIRKYWIKDQIEYHQKKSVKTKSLSVILEKGGMLMFGITIAAALTHLIFFSVDHEYQSRVLENALTFLVIVFPAVGAAIEGIRSHREYSRIEKRSKNMGDILADMDERFSHISTPEGLESLLREAEELMVSETQDWLMLMRFAELKPVA
jgi:hypothetical protein